MRRFLAALALSASAATSAMAGTVAPTNSVVFAFDTSALTSYFEIVGGEWQCGAVCRTSTPSFDPENRLQAESSFTWSFGTTAGGDELGSKTFTLLDLIQFAIGFDGSIDLPSDLVQTVTPSGFLPLPASVQTVFVTFEHVDDVFHVAEACLAYNTPRAQAAFQEEICSTEPSDLAVGGPSGTTPVPLPAGGALLVTALGSMALARRRRRH